MDESISMAFCISDGSFGLGFGVLQVVREAMSLCRVCFLDFGFELPSLPPLVLACKEARRPMVGVRLPSSTLLAGLLPAGREACLTTLRKGLLISACSILAEEGAPVLPSLENIFLRRVAVIDDFSGPLLPFELVAPGTPRLFCC